MYQVLCGFTISSKRQPDEPAAERKNEWNTSLRIKIPEGMERHSFKYKCQDDRIVQLLRDVTYYVFKCTKMNTTTKCI